MDKDYDERDSEEIRKLILSTLEDIKEKRLILTFKLIQNPIQNLDKISY